MEKISREVLCSGVLFRDLLDQPISQELQIKKRIKQNPFLQIRCG